MRETLNINVNFKFTELSDRIFTGLVLAGIAGLIALSGALIRFDNFFYDLGRYLSFKPAPNDVVIVAIDEASLQSIGQWPWPRSLHAEFLNKLSSAQARAIGLDILFDDSQRTDPDSEQVLANAIGQARNVVMPILFEESYAGAPVRQRMPAPAIASKATGLGRVHVRLDSDDIARSIYLWQGLSADGLNATGFPHFAQAALQVARQFPLNMPIQPPNLKVTNPIALKQGGFLRGQVVSKGQRRISFAGPPGHFQRVSYATVLSGKYPADFFKDKIVLVGVTAAGLADPIPTAVSSASQPMPRVEFLANAIVSMRDHQLVSDAPLWFTSLLCVLLALAPLTWLHKLPRQKSLYFIALYLLTVMLLMVLISYIFHVWIAMSAVLVAVLLAFPVWSWRRLDSAQVFLDRELQHLRDELAVLGMEQEAMPAESDADPLQSRILKVKLTAKHLRDMHKGRSDTLAFISHDIRAPLGAAMMLLSEFEENKHADRMKRMLGRAYSMAEGFLQASKAEMINVNKFHELDIVSIVQQAVDDVYEIAVVKKIEFLKVLPEESVWIRGDFGLLLRAVSNILINAVNYSPDGASVKVELKRDHQLVTLEITDQGPGIPAAKVSKLFRRFSRVDAEHQSREGSGLGLYFVGVTIRKHHGEVSVKSQLGHGSTFIISMPLERRRGNKPVEHERRAAPKPSLFGDTV